jgi:hypothetical protein
VSRTERRYPVDSSYFREADPSSSLAFKTDTASVVGDDE